MLENNLKLIFILILTFISCSKSTDFKKRNKILTDYQWFSFVKEKQVFILNEAVADSLVLYFLKEEAPEVVKPSKAILWHQGEIMYDTDFNDFKRISFNHFIFLGYRKKTYSIFELSFKDKLTINHKYGMNLTHVPCEEIESAILSSVTKDSIYTNVNIHDTCFDRKKTPKVSTLRTE